MLRCPCSTADIDSACFMAPSMGLQVVMIGDSCDKHFKCVGCVTSFVMLILTIGLILGAFWD